MLWLINEEWREGPLDIGIDFDGVLYKFVNALRRYIHETTGRPLATMPEASCWEFYEKDWGLTLQEFLKFFNDGVNAGYIFFVGEPYEGAREGLVALKNAGHRLHLVTDRAAMGAEGVAETLTKAYIKKYALPYDTLTLSADKTAVKTDVFVEDRDKNYWALEEAGVATYLVDYPYNRHVTTPPGRRVASFKHFADIFSTKNYF